MLFWIEKSDVGVAGGDSAGSVLHRFIRQGGLRLLVFPIAADDTFKIILPVPTAVTFPVAESTAATASSSEVYVQA